MSRFNTNATHPLIPNSQQYMFEQQYVSIHSEDRNILKYPNASEFEIAACRFFYFSSVNISLSLAIYMFVCLYNSHEFLDHLKINKFFDSF